MRTQLLIPLFMAYAVLLSAQGEIVEVTLLETLSQQELQQLNPLAEYGCDVYKIQYTTTDLDEEIDTASGAFFIPDGEGERYPLLVYQHGTVNDKFQVPSRGSYEVAPFTASMGYLTLAPDYLGLGDSRGFHPYVHSATEASAAIDMMFALRDYLDGEGIAYNDQLFVTGYSQGGHGGAALHKAVEDGLAGDFEVTAAAHLSGPYSISGEMAGLLFNDSTEYFYPGFIGNTYLSYNEVYELYDSTAQFFKQPYADIVDFYFANFESGNSSIGLSYMNNRMIDSLTAREGGSFPGAMLQDSILNITANEADHPVSQALRDNDLFDWSPQAPTRLFYCMADDQVPFTNSLVADSVMNLNGAPDVRSADVGSDLNHVQCVAPAVTQMILFFEGFKEVTSTRELASLPGVNAFPNPAQDRLFLSHVPAGSRVQFFSPDGRLVVEQELQGTPAAVALDGLPQGLYLVQVLAAEGRWTGRVIVAD